MGYVQAGIVAWGVGCGETGTPGVYADVSQAVCWIDYIMSGRGAPQGSNVQSFWGYGSDTCGGWRNYKIESGLPDVIVQKYQMWNVEWEEPVVVIEQNARQEGDGSYSANEPLTQGGDGYVDDTKVAEPYSDDTKVAEPYSDASQVAEPYSDDAKVADPYSDVSKVVDLLTDSNQGAEPYSDAIRDAEPYSDGIKGSEPYSEDQVVDVAKTADPYRR